MLAFIHIHKTGGSTIETILQLSIGRRYAFALPWRASFHWSELFSPVDFRKLLHIYPGMLGFGSHNVRAYKGLDRVVQDIQYFTFVCNPLKMRISMYQHGRRLQITLKDTIKHPVRKCLRRYQYGVRQTEKQTFEEWCKDDQTCNRLIKMIVGTADVNEAVSLINEKKIFVGITELFDKSLIFLKSLLSPDLDISYHRVNVASDKTISRELLSNPSTVQMAKEGISADIELYEYIKNEVFHIYQRDYEKSLAVEVEKFQRTNRGFYQRNLIAWKVKHILYRLILIMYRKSKRIV